MPNYDKVVFLDIDGVLNNDTTSTYLQKQKKSWWVVDPQNVSVLNRVIEKTSASIVITSMWKQHMSLPELKAVLTENGFKYPTNIVDVTSIQLKNRDIINRATNGIGLRPNTSLPRVWEILEWLDANRTSNYVVIDDMNIADGNKNVAAQTENIMKKFIEVDSTDGLTESYVEKICSFLNA